MDVKRDWMQLTIDELETALETLEDKKTDLDKNKKELISSIDDLERQVKAKEEAALKRLVAKLQRDKNPKIKELIQKFEDCTQANEETSHHLKEEIEKHDKFLVE